jgi:hypothetical protein
MPIPRSTVGTYFSGPVAMASSRETFGIRGKSKSTFASDGKELFFLGKTVTLLIATLSNCGKFLMKIFTHQVMLERVLWPRVITLGMVKAVEDFG